MHITMYMFIADEAKLFWALDIWLIDLVLQCINSMSSNPVEGDTKFVSLKI